MAPGTDWPALLLVGLGLVTGWILSSRRPAARNLIKTHESIKKQAQAQAQATEEAASKIREEVVVKANKTSKKIDQAGLKKLAEMVRNTFGRK
tara:strand:+ start:5264 stop:5542 length:279 start_codon:yes stop_codon:yes gene_type:complete